MLRQTNGRRLIITTACCAVLISGCTAASRNADSDAGSRPGCSLPRVELAGHPVSNGTRPDVPASVGVPIGLTATYAAVDGSRLASGLLVLAHRDSTTTTDPNDDAQPDSAVLAQVVAQATAHPADADDVTLAFTPSAPGILDIYFLGTAATTDNCSATGAPGPSVMFTDLLGTLSVS
ncbi:MAG TPA: hypothetical protein VFR11_09880 [Micromonosporaceae bacterium]|nr:hypothetical protein [Micromonosporaceae bacterium]